MKEEPGHGLNWSPGTKQVFSKSMVKGRRKDFAVVSRRLKKLAGDCQAYYYSSFKGTREYSKIKRTLKRQGRRGKTRSSTSRSGVSPSECVKCTEVVGELICCTNLPCATPKLNIAPSGNWFCEECDPKE